MGRGMLSAVGLERCCTGRYMTHSSDDCMDNCMDNGTQQETCISTDAQTPSDIPAQSDDVIMDDAQSETSTLTKVDAGGAFDSKSVSEDFADSGRESKSDAEQKDDPQSGVDLHEDSRDATAVETHASEDDADDGVMPPEHSSQIPVGAQQKMTPNAANTGVDAIYHHPIRRLKKCWSAYKRTRFYRIWNKRPRFSYGAYVVVAFVLIEIVDMGLLWSVTKELTYDSNASESMLQQIISGTYHWLSGTSAILNFFALGIIYLICVTLINRFWIGTALFVVISGIFTFANKVKVTMRDEPIIPSDLTTMTAGGAGNVTSFATADMQSTIHAGIVLVVWSVVLCLLLQIVDKRSMFIHCSWRRPFSGPKNIIGTVSRVLAPILSVCLIVTYATGLSNLDSGVRKFVDEIGYVPRLWNVMEDAQMSGAATTFLSLTKVKAMESEPDYGKPAMQRIYNRYARQADAINMKRAGTLTDNTVIMVLSESFSDPTRVPGVKLVADPMPGIRGIESTTTSGLMLSPGYGGGTANIEFQQMTGLSMANFSDSMLSPYQQLVPNRLQFFSFNQMWNQACGSDACSVGFHPYLQGFYLRNVNYQKFGFSHLYTLDSNPQIKHQGAYQGVGGTSETVTDEQAYQNVLDEINDPAGDNRGSQYIELVTMQNHSPYPDVYGNSNEFKDDNDSEVPTDERNAISTYAKGVQRTDQATLDFLDQLDAMNKPITVVFYGDHLPGIYTTASQDPANDLALHETDYFIWSNKASQRSESLTDAKFSSSNYFMAQVAEQTDAKVSPYLALLTVLHERIAAMSKPIASVADWSVAGSPTYLDSDGNPINPDALSDEDKQLLEDYRMVQYDMCVGKNYLQDMGFMGLPSSHS